MDSRKAVFQETAVVLTGQAICVAAMVGVFALMGHFDTSVLLGGIAGAFIAVLNYFLMAVFTTMAADKAAHQDVKGGQSLISFSYIFRMALLFVLLFACGKSGLMNLFALVLPLVFTRPILTIAEFFKKER